MSRPDSRPHIQRQARLSALLILAAFAAFTVWQAAPAGAAPARTLEFRGHEVRVPPAWPVFRLAQHPGMCVRLDRRAVYLGTPSADQRCPADAAIGRRRAILVDPSAAAHSGAGASAIPSPATGAAAGGGVFTGLGFDACSAPSTKAMAAWSSSPYRAIGVYIGGANRACSQPNLTPTWVGTQTAAGWHLIPTYVGLQAPTSSCSSCAKLSAAKAGGQGAAAAVDAVAKAGAVAIGPGSPIYFDMESYTPGSSATAATLAFLQAWTRKLHSLGYVSGVYSSSASGIVDLANAVGSGYTEPDDLWIADWNGRKSTTDSAVPAGAWTPHQRIHQYEGGHNETFGGVTINIDNDYVDGATGGGEGVGPDDPIGSLELVGGHPGQVRVRGWAFDPDAPTLPVSIRVFVGGRAGTPGAEEYELGPIATEARAEIGPKYPEAGSAHGFDAMVTTVKSGSQPVCVYAVDIEPGRDRLLGCRTTPIPVAITLSNIRETRTGVSVRIACQWPAGTACPGQILLRTRLKVAEHRRRRSVRIHTVTRSVGHRSFQLTGAHSHVFTIPLSTLGRTLLAQRGSLKAQLVAAIPGGRRIAALGLGS